MMLPPWPCSSIAARAIFERKKSERTFVFMVANAAGQQFVPQSTIRITREMTFDDAAVLSKQAEETLLWRDIQNDMVQQLMRRLAAAKPKPADS